MEEPVALGLSLGILAIVALISLAFTVFWVAMLVNAAMQEKWVWFVVMLFFGIVAFIFFFTDRRPFDELREERDRRRALLSERS